MTRFACWCAVLLTVPVVAAQEMPKPGPEVDLLKKHVGTWETTTRHGGHEMKGTATYTLDLGGLWLMNKANVDMGGMKYMGHGMESFDQVKKKYVNIWVDNMATGPSILEGSFDPATKMMTYTGEGPGKDGKTIKQKTTYTWKDDNNFDFAMYEGDAKEPALTVSYQRK